VSNRVEAAITDAMARELRAKAHDMEITFQPVSVFQLAALVQLALRHPDVGESLRETAQRFLAGVRGYFADCPTVLDVVRRGDDPHEDRIVDRRVLTDRLATADPLFAAVVKVARMDVQAGATHDCGEWWLDGKCALCDRPRTM